MTNEKKSRYALILNRAEVWRYRNEDVYLAMGREALRRAENGDNVRVSGLIEWVSKKSLTDSEGREAGINKTWEPIISRWLVKDFPELADHIKQRHSIFEKIMTEPRDE